MTSRAMFPILIRTWALVLLTLAGLAVPLDAHSPGKGQDAALPPPPADELGAYAQLLGQPPVGVVDLGEKQVVAVMATPSGRHQIAYVDWYLKTAQRMPVILEQAQRLSGIQSRGDRVEFHAEDADAELLYLWDPEESGPPAWRRRDKRTHAVTYSPGLEADRVATFYLRDGQAQAKLAAARETLKRLRLNELTYVDSEVLILTGPDGAKNMALRWADDRWAFAGVIDGIVNHHAVADLNGDGLVEVLAGDNDVQGKCTRSWSVLYTWNADKTEVVATPVRADSISNLSGSCDERPQSCFQEESLTWDVHAKGGPTVELKGMRDTACAGCATGGTEGTRESYVAHYRWNAAKGAFLRIEP